MTLPTIKVFGEPFVISKMLKVWKKNTIMMLLKIDVKSSDLN